LERGVSQTAALVLCADDYALNAAVSAGIVQLARQGRLTATSAMVLSPRWAHDAPALRELHANLDVGVHLDWTSAFAQAAGHGAGLNTWMLRAMLSAMLSAFDAPQKRTQLREAIERQLDAFEAQWHHAPDHVDGHQHVHQFAGIRQVLIEVLQRRYGQAVADRTAVQAQGHTQHALQDERKRPWLRISQVGQPGLKARVISAWGARPLQHWARSVPWPHVAPLLGVYDFDPQDGVYAQHMTAWLQGLPPASVLMCHPASEVSVQTMGWLPDNAVANDNGPAHDPIHLARLREFDYLASNAFAQALHNANVRLVRGSAIAADASTHPGDNAHPHA
jgi:predicted glycoside hydrolase/deacetylase ChbG (UPF0249 family)